MRIALQVLFVVAVAAAGPWLLVKLASVLLVLVLSTLFAYVIAPLVHLLTRPIRMGGWRGVCRAGWPSPLSTSSLPRSVWTGAALVLPSATDQVEDVVAGAPAFTQSLVAWERGWQRYYTRLRIPIELRRAIDQSALTAGEAMAAGARDALLAFVSAITVRTLARADPDSCVPAAEGCAERQTDSSSKRCRRAGNCVVTACRGAEPGPGRRISGPSLSRAC